MKEPSATPPEPPPVKTFMVVIILITIFMFTYAIVCSLNKETSKGSGDDSITVPMKESYDYDVNG